MNGAPPAFSDFKFTTIGQQPSLLGRIQMGGPEATLSLPSPSPQPDYEPSPADSMNTGKPNLLQRLRVSNSQANVSHIPSQNQALSPLSYPLTPPVEASRSTSFPSDQPQQRPLAALIALKDQLALFATSLATPDSSPVTTCAHAAKQQSTLALGKAQLANSLSQQSLAAAQAASAAASESLKAAERAVLLADDSISSIDTLSHQIQSLGSPAALLALSDTLSAWIVTEQTNRRATMDAQRRVSASPLTPVVKNEPQDDDGRLIRSHSGSSSSLPRSSIQAVSDEEAEELRRLEAEERKLAADEQRRRAEEDSLIKRQKQALSEAEKLAKNLQLQIEHARQQREAAAHAVSEDARKRREFVQAKKEAKKKEAEEAEKRRLEAEKAQQEREAADRRASEEREKVIRERLTAELQAQAQRRADEVHAAEEKKKEERAAKEKEERLAREKEAQVAKEREARVAKEKADRERNNRAAEAKFRQQQDLYRPSYNASADASTSSSSRILATQGQTSSRAGSVRRLSVPPINHLDDGNGTTSSPESEHILTFSLSGNDGNAEFLGLSNDEAPLDAQQVNLRHISPKKPKPIAPASRSEPRARIPSQSETPRDVHTKPKILRARRSPIEPTNRLPRPPPPQAPRSETLTSSSSLPPSLPTRFPFTKDPVNRESAAAASTSHTNTQTEPPAVPGGDGGWDRFKAQPTATIPPPPPPASREPQVPIQRRRGDHYSPAPSSRNYRYSPPSPPPLSPPPRSRVMLGPVAGAKRPREADADGYDYDRDRERQRRRSESPDQLLNRIGDQRQGQLPWATRTKKKVGNGGKGRGGGISNNNGRPVSLAERLTDQAR